VTCCVLMWPRHGAGEWSAFYASNAPICQCKQFLHNAVLSSCRHHHHLSMRKLADKMQPYSMYRVGQKTGPQTHDYNSWQSYKQEHDSLVHFARLGNTPLNMKKLHKTITFLVVTLSKIYRF